MKEIGIFLLRFFSRVIEHRAGIWDDKTEPIILNLECLCKGLTYYQTGKFKDIIMVALRDEFEIFP